ncbi:MAG: sulfurtransferase TusA family protein [Thermodesulfovibrionales bacterium]
MGELSSKTPDQVLDVLGRVCPYPLVLSKKALEKMASGQVLKILCDAPASAEDSIPKFAEKQGYKFESSKQAGDTWELYIQKS